MPTATFSRIRIIESIPDGEMKTGRKLHDELAALEAYHQLGVVTSHIKCDTASAFLAELAAIRVEAEGGARHILHIEAHGGESGLQLASGEQLSWDEMAPDLAEINRASGLNLFLVVAACFGAEFTKETRLYTPAMMRAIIGPTNEAWPHEILTAFVSFYNEVFANRDGDKAVTALMKSPKRHPYYFASVEKLFRDGFAMCIKEFTGDRLVARAKQLAKRAQAEGKDWDVLTAGITLATTMERYFESCRRQHFMIDSFPENAARFPVTLEDCAALAEKL